MFWHVTLPEDLRSPPIISLIIISIIPKSMIIYKKWRSENESAEESYCNGLEYDHCEEYDQVLLFSSALVELLGKRLDYYALLGLN